MKGAFYNKLKIPVILIVVLLSLLSASTVSFASETILSTTVPSYFTLQIDVSGHGNVEVMGQEFTESGNIRIERNQSVELIFIPDENYHIEKVRFNDKDITDNLQDNRITIDELERAYTKVHNKESFNKMIAAERARTLSYLKENLKEDI